MNPRIMSLLMYDATSCYEAISMMTSLDVFLAKQCFAATNTWNVTFSGFSEIPKKDPSVHSSTAFLVASQTALPPIGH